VRLTRIRMQGYRSVRARLDLPIDPRVTVLLGANDHGKSNILHALRHLNDDVPFSAEDINWDSDDPEAHPHVSYWIDLSEDDKAALLDIANRVIEGEALQEAETGDPSAAAKAPAKPLTLLHMPAELQIERKGLAGKRIATTPRGLPSGAATELIKERLPRVELIQPFDRVPDEVTAAELPTESFEFMQGLFRYAGIEEAEWAGIFEQDAKTSRRLADASRVLSDTLRATWSQGRELDFSLAHHSAHEAVELRITEPSIKGRFVRASQRSSGFTHFFSLRAVLHARQERKEAASYIWLFDEPGIYLHPAGQHDLLQALESIAEHNQVVYSTHSIFLVNKNYPPRHRLVLKRATGTVIDSKPYTSGWHPALEALGLALPGTILFAKYVLITEGDSDPVLLYALLRKVLEAGKVDVDLNPLAIVGSGDSRNADVLIRVLSEAVQQPKIAVLLDGDKGGSDRLAALKRTLDNKGIPFRQLTKETSIEDHVPFLDDSYVSAVAEYVIALREDAGKGPDKVREKLKASFGATFPKASTTVGVAAWARNEGRILGELDSYPSAVGIARAYAELISDRNPTDFAKLPKRTADLVSWVTTTLGLPSPVASEEQILEPPA
jgi:predicted ATPase